MKAIVTGGLGFIGSHLVEALLNNGAKVHILDNAATNRLENSDAVIHRVDIRRDNAKQIIVNVKPDIIFHLAAQADVSESILNPKYDADVNIIGTINVLQASIEADVKKIIFASTSAVYGQLQKELISEDDSAIPVSYYGLSKLTAESYIRLFGSLHGITYSILRYGNVYGPRQIAKGEGGVIAVFLDRVKKQRPVTIHGDGEQTRDFIFVKDVVRANLAAIDTGHDETIHVSTGCKQSINDVFHLLTRIHGLKIVKRHQPARSGDIKHSCLDNRKARRLLHWQPQVDLYNGLKMTYDNVYT